MALGEKSLVRDPALNVSNAAFASLLCHLEQKPGTVPQEVFLAAGVALWEGKLAAEPAAAGWSTLALFVRAFGSPKRPSRASRPTPAAAVAEKEPAGKATGCVPLGSAGCSFLLPRKGCTKLKDSEIYREAPQKTFLQTAGWKQLKGRGGCL